MGRAEPLLLTGIFVVFVALYGALPWLAGGLYLDTHEGDSYHLMDILTRMQRGAVPHIDFVTPLGALGLWPTVWLLKAGLSAGAALILSQLGFAFCLLPFVAYAAATRLNWALALFFGLSTLGLVLALSYGTAISGVGISMHYNRWAWAVSFTLLLLALVPARRVSRPRVDGALIGALTAALLLLKATYFVAFLPVAAIALWQMHKARGLAAALLSGSLIAGVITLIHGVGYWLGYIHDLQLVSRTEVRPFVGMSFDQIAAEPTHLGATLAGIAAVLVIRRAVPGLTGLAVLLLIPGFMFITYQNFGNDPQWLIFLPVLLLALRPGMEGEIFGTGAARVASITSVAAFALFFPSFSNMSLSPVSHLSLDKSNFVPMFPESAGHQDLLIRKDRAYMMTAQIYRDQEPGPWTQYAALAERSEIPEFQRIRFPYCEWMAGSRAMFETLGADLAEAGLPQGAKLFTTDLVAAYWFFAPVAPPQGSAPWYYGELSGLEDTDYVMVPKCTFSTRVRNIILGELEASDFQFTLVRNNDLMALFRVSR